MPWKGRNGLLSRVLASARAVDGWRRRHDPFPSSPSVDVEATLPLRDAAKRAATAAVQG